MDFSAINGNSLTRKMHELTFRELDKMRLESNGDVLEISPEKSVILAKNGKPREGRFDFLVVKGNKKIGIEVLTRPSKGKLRAKLPYANEADEFIFVLPKDSLNFYKNPKGKVFHSWKKVNSFGREFSSNSLKAWLLDSENEKFVEKGLFREVFNVKK